jgi:hypothetical protein
VDELFGAFMLALRRLLTLLPIVALLGAVPAPLAAASTTQEAIFQDDGQLSQNLDGTLSTLRGLGVTRVRVSVAWSRIAPQPNSTQAPKGFNAIDPAAYPAANWGFYDQVLERAKADGIAVDFLLTAPAPLWANAPGEPRGGPFGIWKPNAADFGAFVKAVGTRYSGSYRPPGASAPLPRLNFWAIWNEPNYGPDLAPQATNHDAVELSPAEYRALLDHAWTALAASGHGHDTILFGETAPHGKVHPIGNFSGMYPLRFLRALYCVSASFKALSGTAASQRGCPTTAAASRKFRAQHPALFAASAFAVHPYTEHTPPNVPLDRNPDSADLAGVPKLERTLDHLARVYGSHRQLPIYSTEYGYQTHPPEPASSAVSPATQAVYLNWAEYISYKQSRVRSYSQYLLADPPRGNFASALEFSDGQAKPALAAYRIPLYLPQTSAQRGSSLEVWGGVRPAHFARLDTGKAQTAQIQFQTNSKGAFATLKSVAIGNVRGYFDVHQSFSHSGTVRVAWTDASGQTDYSRSVQVKIH